MSAIIALVVHSPSCLPTSSIFFMSASDGLAFLSIVFAESCAHLVMSSVTFCAQSLSFLSAQAHILSLNSTILPIAAAAPPSAFFLQPANERSETAATNASERFFMDPFLKHLGGACLLSFV